MQFGYRYWRIFLAGVIVLLFTTSAYPQPGLTQLDAGRRAKEAETLGTARDANAIERLIPMLKDADPDVRKAAAMALGKLDDARAIHPLFAILRNDADPGVCEGAEQGIYRIWDLTAVDPLLEELQSDDPTIRKEAVHYLARFPEPRVYERLAEVMATDPATYVREEAVTALGSLHDPRAVPALIGMLEHKTPGMRGLAAQLLGGIADPRAVEPLIKLARHDPDNSEIQQERAIEALGRIGDARAVKPLLALLPGANNQLRSHINGALYLFPATAVPEILPALTDTNPVIRRQAARLLGRLGDPRAIDPLLIALHDQDLTVRNAAIEALGAFHDDRVIEPLAAILRTKVTTHDPEAEKARESDAQYKRFGGLRVMDLEPVVDAVTLSVNAALSLGKTDNLLAVTPLMEAYNDDERWIREAAMEGLQRMHNPQAGAALIPLLARVKPERQSTLVTIIGSMGGPQVTGFLLQQLQNADPAVRLNTIAQLATSTDARVPAALLPLLRDPDAQVRGMAAYALGHLKSMEATEPLLQMLTTDADQNARASAAYALGEMKVQKAVPALIAALQQTKKTDLFAQACFALEIIGDAQAVPALITAAKNPTPSLRWQSLSAIGSFDDPRVTATLVAALNDPVPHIRPTVVRALGLRKEAWITDTLVGLLNDNDADVRAAAAEALGMRMDVKAVEPLIALLLRDKNSRQTVAEALGKLKDPRAVRPLMMIYYDPEYGTSNTIITALGMIGSDRAKAELTRIIRLRWGDVATAEKALAAAQGE